MAYSQSPHSISPQSLHYRDPHSHSSHRRHASKQRFVEDLSQCLFEFVIQLLPTTEEMAVKDDVRKLLERLIRTIEPDSRLLSFGSTANGFSLRNSGTTYSSILFLTQPFNSHIDMDLCCLIDSKERLAATDLVTMLGDLLERGMHSPYALPHFPVIILFTETKFHVKTLPHARIPIVKLSLDPSPGLPLGIACDIGFENRLALENTRLLMCYALVDPTRVRTMVLFRQSFSFSSISR
jgi:terminal uridylyltransferase